MKLSTSIEARIADKARQVLSGDVGIVEGSRQLVQLAGRLDERDDVLFAPIVAVESETEDIPFGETRLHWSEESLRRKDEAVAAYLNEIRAEILKVCRELVQRYRSAS